MTRQTHEIKHVARLTGLNPHRIRAWERRYGAVNPGISPTNRRCYNENDINRLLLLRRAVAPGHRIVRLDDNVLGNLAGANEAVYEVLNSGPKKLDQTLRDAAFDAAKNSDIRWCWDLDAFRGGLEALALQAESRPA